MDLNSEGEELLMDKIFIKATIYHPIDKTSLMCSGKVNDYELG